MSKTIVVYGSSTGTCEAIAQTIGEKLGANVINVSDLTANDVKEADNLILGTSTWGSGEMQDDWYDGVKVLKEAGLSGMKELYDAAEAAGATMVGNDVATDGYTYDDSDSVVDGHFIGLALDDVNEDDQTEARIDAWIPTLGF